LNTLDRGSPANQPPRTTRFGQLLLQQALISGVALGLCLVPALAVGQVPAAPGTDPLYVPGQNVAIPDGALSFLSNPAGLRTAAASDLRLQTSVGGARLGSGRGLGWGAFVAKPVGALAFGAALEHTRDSPGGDSAWYSTSRASLGASWAVSDALALGATSRWNATLDGALRQTWDIGLLYQPWRWLSLGGRWALLGNDRDDADPRRPSSRAALGVAIRPLSTDKLTLGLEHDAPIGESGGTTGLQLGWHVIPGLQLVLDHRDVAPVGVAGLAESLHDQRTTLQVRLSFGKLGVDVGLHGGQGGDGSGDGGGTLGLRVSGDRLPSLYQRRHNAIVVPLASTSEAGEDGLSFTETLLDLRRIALTPKLSLVVLRADSLQLDWAQVEELRASIAELRRNGKQVVWYASELSTRQLAVAAACNRIAMPPAATVSARGVAADFVSVSDALTKLGVAIQILRHSEYKTAFEDLARPEPSPQLQERLQASVDRAWSEFSTAVALGRDVTPGQLDAALAAGVTRPEDAKRAKLIDGVAGPEALEDLLREWKLLGADESLVAWEAPIARRRQWSTQPRIAVIPLSGTISDEAGGWSPLGQTMGGRDKAKEIAALADDEATKAVVARIASPGGAVLGSDYLRAALSLTAKRKPVVASMGGVAASGGYWASLGASYVLADRNTVTGSIGIIAVRPSFAGLYDKLGIRTTHFGRGAHHDTLNLSRPATESELTFLHGQLGRYYDLFVDHVVERRKLSREAVLAAAGGRVHFGDDALRLRLIDAQGGVLQALDEAYRRAKLRPEDEVKVEVVGKRGWFAQVGIGMRTQMGATDTEQQLQALTRAVQEVAGPWLDAAAILQAVGSDKPAALELLP
jgi:protease-4